MSRLPPGWLQSRVFNRLALTAGTTVAIDEIVEATYGDDPNGGPADGRAAVRAAITFLRRRGVVIRNRHGYGYELPRSRT